MAQSVGELDSSWMSSSSQLSYEQSMQLLQENCSNNDHTTTIMDDSLDQSLQRSESLRNIPKPPPPPAFAIQPQESFKINQSSCKSVGYMCVPKGIVNSWDRIFEEGNKADVHVKTDDGGIIHAHSNILGVASPVIRNILKSQSGRWRMKTLCLTGIPYGAARTFIRFLYSSRCDNEEMEKFSLHLLVLSHVYSIPILKSFCTQSFEGGLLTTDNVIDVLQLSRMCDASRLNLLCMRLIVKNFKTISKSEGWKVMRETDSKLEQELLGAVVEADSSKQERLRKIEEKKIYLQLYDAMEALIHICRDGCRTIGPYDKELDENQGPCNFPACKGLESLVRHFAGCKVRVPGGCVHCKRMWQLLELHSRMCSEPDACKVPLCRHFKEKMQQQSKKDEVKWKVLVSKVMAAKRAVNSFSSSQLANSPL